MRQPLLAVMLVTTGMFAQDAIDARQRGFEHGYRDGYEYGRDVRARGASLDFRTDAYRQADRGYRPFLGSRESYQDGYRTGYQNGAEDAVKGNSTRFEEVYGLRDRDFDPDRVRDDRYVASYRDRRYGYEDVAADVGYRDGLSAGLKDFREHHSYRPQEHDAYKDADRGYNSAFGKKDEYKLVYRQAYEKGYRDGFGR
jgi:hypothetical protein